MELLLPFLLEQPAYCSFSAGPSKILDQLVSIGLDVEDLLQSLQLNNRDQRCTRTSAGSRESTKDAGTTISCKKDQYEASLDVQQFKPEEISVRVTGDNQLTVEGKHDEKQDDYGYISRHFVRRYILPKNYDISKIESKLSSDGVLTITAPVLEEKDVEHTVVPIEQTGEPAKQQAVDQKNEVKT